MNGRSLRRPMLAALAVVALAVALAAPARAQIGDTFVDGFVTDAVTGRPIAGACIALGPSAIRCTQSTDAAGYYKETIPDISTQWRVWAVKDGYQDGNQAFRATAGAGPYRVNLALQPETVYLPNVTKTLGGPAGWVTPFIVQNAGTMPTNLDVAFYRFSDGALVARRTVRDLRPGTSYADIPDHDADLPGDSQFSVVVRSTGVRIVAVVNEHAGGGTRAEAGSYVGASKGALSVFLPNVTKRFFGWSTPFIIQNLGTAPTVAMAQFISFDGLSRVRLTRAIAPGRSQFIDPRAEPSLVDGAQFAVTIAADQPLSVVENLHNDENPDASPLMYSLNGIAGGAASVYGPYAVKNVRGVGKGGSTIVVQNVGGGDVTPSLTFTPLGGGPTLTFRGPRLASGASWAFDPRYANGDVKQPFCGTFPPPGCLPDGEWSFVATSAEGTPIVAEVNVIGDTTAAGYNAQAAPQPGAYLPNVTRTLGGADGWTTPLVVQSVAATTLTLSWFRFSDGSLVATQSLPIAPATARRIDPREVAALADDTQYAVVVRGAASDAAPAAVAAIVTELNFQGGDGAMTYEGFARP